MVTAQAETRRKHYLRSPTKAEDLAVQQWNLGEANGMETVFAMLKTLIQVAESDLNKLQETNHG